MPSSQPWRIHYVAEFIYRLKPLSVLDIGVGFGKWGVIAREYTDVNKGRCAKNQWRVRIDGIEIFPAYENVIWGVYNQVHIGNVINILPTLGKYDLIMAIEILEHMKRDDGLRMVAMMKAKSKHYIISYSNSVSPAVYGNKYEEHISKWTAADFKDHKLMCERGLSQVYIGKGNLT